jgi:hypothetical protein
MSVGGDDAQPLGTDAKGQLSLKNRPLATTRTVGPQAIYMPPLTCSVSPVM